MESGVLAGNGGPAVHVRMLGPMTVSRAGAAVKLPASRKVRAVVAYLALAPHAMARSHLCELLWDVPDDPRGELRWCLSKIRRLFDEPGRPRVETSGDGVRLDLADCFVDAVEIGRALEAGIETLPAERLQALSALFEGEFLEGLDIDRSPEFGGWLTAQRRRFRAGQAAILEHLVKRVPPDTDAGFRSLEKLLELTPFDQRAHENLLAALARRGRIREGEEHLAATARRFEAEGFDWSPLRDAWRAAKARQPSVMVSPGGIVIPSPPLATPDSAVVPAASRRASIAVMPFLDQTPGSIARGRLADGLAHDVITRLAKLRSLFVIAQGTVFALGDRGVGPEEAGRTLNVDYVASGTIRRQGKRMSIAVELTETRTAHIVWADEYDEAVDDALNVLDEIGDRIVASIAGEIETAERNRAILKPPSSLDAWEAYHRGLWHMYRFSRADNEQAQHFFEMAVRLDSTFARAYAGLSFTHFQNAFQDWADRERETERAFAAAGQSMMIDDRDPAAHWAMGRALWLRREPEQAVVELKTAVDLSPNFALGHYTLSFVSSQSGDPHAAIESSDRSRHLSPFDPLMFAMLATRALAHFRLGQYDEA
ncbi:MAG TPA: BTAD domain-containing putative transcriptional regulator, partial [Alphaproteobacteria bacterium]|nr:BTAD domain-containing putative transcriptional regulator [Alphaproteobacteria bacterium]